MLFRSLFALGAGDRVVGVTNLCDYPLEAQQLPKIGSWIHQQDTAAFDQLKPDLILTSMFVPQTVKGWADRNGVKLVNVYPQTIAGVYDSILEIGELVQRDTEAERVVAEMRKEFTQIQQRAVQFPHHPRIYTEEYHIPPTVAVNWVPELIAMAGGKPMALPGKLSYAVTSEQVAAFDPELIVLHWCGFGQLQNPELVHKREGWKYLRAVRENRICAIDDTFLNRPGPRLWRGAELLQHAIRQILNP